MSEGALVSGRARLVGVVSLIGAVHCTGPARRPTAETLAGHPSSTAAPLGQAAARAPRSFAVAPSASVIVEERGSSDAACALSGTLRLRHVFIADNPSLQHSVLQSDRLDVASVTLPETLPGPVRLAALFPLHGVWWLSSDDMPLVLTSKVSLSGDRVWLPKGTPVSGSGGTKGMIHVVRPAEPHDYMRRTPVFERDVPCREVSLAGTAAPAERAPMPEDVASFHGDVPLSASPGGGTIATLHVPFHTTLEIRERRGAWRRIVGDPLHPFEDVDYLPFAFDAWTDAPSEEAFGTGGLGLAAALPKAKKRYVTISEVQLRTVDGKPIATLAVDVAFAVSDSTKEFVEVEEIQDLSPAKPLVIASSDLTEHTRASP